MFHWKKIIGFPPHPQPMWMCSLAVFCWLYLMWRMAHSEKNSILALPKNKFIFFANLVFFFVRFYFISRFCCLYVFQFDLIRLRFHICFSFHFYWLFLELARTCFVCTSARGNGGNLSAVFYIVHIANNKVYKVERGLQKILRE